MLSVNPETVCFIITKAHEFHAKEEVVIPDVPNSPADDWGRQILADHVDDYSYQEMVSAINDLEPDQAHELVVLMWIGRGDYEVDEWADALRDAQDFWDRQTVSNMIATPLLADYLSEGLDLLGYSCEE
jgi:hypothetical protein